MIQRRLRIGYNRTTRMSNQDPFSSYTGDLFGSHFTFCSPSKPFAEPWSRCLQRLHPTKAGSSSFAAGSLMQISQTTGTSRVT